MECFYSLECWKCWLRVKRRRNVKYWVRSLLWWIATPDMKHSVQSMTEPGCESWCWLTEEGGAASVGSLARRQRLGRTGPQLQDTVSRLRSQLQISRIWSGMSQKTRRYWGVGHNLHQTLTAGERDEPHLWRPLDWLLGGNYKLSTNTSLLVPTYRSTFPGVPLRRCRSVVALKH